MVTVTTTAAHTNALGKTARKAEGDDYEIASEAYAKKLAALGLVKVKAAKTAKSKEG